MKTKKSNITEKTIINMLAIAKISRKNAYVPYSHYKVGAAVLMDNGKIYGGCNVENASYGATVCAERIAIFKGISEGAKKIKALMVVTDSNPAWPPCGICRQVICEFAENETPILIANLKGVQDIYRFEDLLPAAFTEKNL